jgi:hypothetical protein
MVDANSSFQSLAKYGVHWPKWLPFTDLAPLDILRWSLQLKGEPTVLHEIRCVFTAALLKAIEADKPQDGETGWRLRKGIYRAMGNASEDCMQAAYADALTPDLIKQWLPHFMAHARVVTRRKVTYAGNKTAFWSVIEADDVLRAALMHLDIRDDSAAKEIMMQHNEKHIGKSFACDLSLLCNDSAIYSNIDPISLLASRVNACVKMGTWEALTIFVNSYHNSMTDPPQVMFVHKKVSLADVICTTRTAMAAIDTVPKNICVVGTLADSAVVSREPLPPSVRAFVFGIRSTDIQPIQGTIPVGVQLLDVETNELVGRTEYGNTRAFLWFNYLLQVLE